jgi:hypothetical protein
MKELLAANERLQTKPTPGQDGRKSNSVSHARNSSSGTGDSQRKQAVKGSSGIRVLLLKPSLSDEAS